MKKANKQSSNRLVLLMGLCLLIFAIIVIRLGYLQIINSADLKKRAIEQWTMGVELKPKRGIIYDRNGKELVISVNAHTLWGNPGEISGEAKKGEKTEKEKTAKELSKVLIDLEEKEILEMLKKESNSVKIVQWLTETEKNKIEKLIKENKVKGLVISDGSRRYYPNDDFASFVLGFTNIDNAGLNGIEKTYDDFLSGETGRLVRSKKDEDKLNYEDKSFASRDGYSIVLTLDKKIQEIAEEATAKAMIETEAKNISIIMMDPNNGDILAMANSPDYNPNQPRKPLDANLEKEWERLLPEELQEKWYDMWRNYAISDIYEPGSTFKTIMAAAAIEENVANPETTFNCTGFIRDIPGEVLKCSRWYRPHNHINLRDGLSESCNVVFVDVGRKLGKEKTLKYIKAFGFGENTGIELLGEQKGIIPEAPESMRDVNLATISYGHGVAVTPIQLVNAISAIANGGDLMKPRLVSRIIDSEGEVIEEIKPEIKRKVISESTSKTMLEMMESVVSNGTGGNAYVPGYRVGGKTGTAQKIINGRYEKGRYIASFVSVAPTDDPQIAMLIIVDEPEGLYYGGSVAAPIASEVLEKTMAYLEIETVYTEKEKEEHSDIKQVPNLVGKTLVEAGELIISSGYKYSVDSNITSEKNRIIKQYPNPGEKLEKGGIIDLYLEEAESKKTIDMPSLIGKPKDEVISKLEGLGLKYHFIGEGVAAIQKPEAGTIVEPNTTIEVEFVEKKE